MSNRRSPVTVALVALIVVVFLAAVYTVYMVNSGTSGKNHILALGLALPARTQVSGIAIGGDSGVIVGSTALFVWIGLALVVYGTAYAVQGWLRSRPTDDDLLVPRDVEAPSAPTPEAGQGYPGMGHGYPGMAPYPYPAPAPLPPNMTQ